MGALGNTNQNLRFVNTYKGKFTISANAETPDAVKRTNKLNKEVWELHFNTLANVIIQEFQKHDHEKHGLSWKILVADSKSDETFSLSLPYSGRTTMGLMLALPNLDINAPLTFKIAYFEKDKHDAMWVIQNGKKVERAWTKDNPGDLPQWEQKEINNETVWDSSKQMKYIENYLEKEVVPKMNDIKVPDSAPSSGGAVQNESAQTTETTSQVAESNAEPIWDADSSCLKKMHTDGSYYVCEADGKFKRDEKGGMLLMADDLPF